MRYSVTYNTPTAVNGTATVDAAGIYSSIDEARLAVHILTGYTMEAINIQQVADAAKILWTKE